MKNNVLYNEEFYNTNRHDIISAEIILPFLLKNLNSESIIDFGCGSGTWLAVAKKLGYKKILGIDGEYVNNSWQLIEKKEFLTGDLTKPIVLDNKYDLAISLEVAEHIDEKYCDIYLKNLTDASDIILFSAAIPGQDGTNHVNEQYPSYWKKKFEKLNYELCDVLRSKFWDNEEIAFWYRQNIMIYVKKNIATEIKNIFQYTKIPLNVVHPKRLYNLCEDIKKYKFERETQINNLNNEVTALNININQKETEKEELKNRIIDLDKNLNQKETEKEELKNKISNLNRIVIEKDDYINKLEEFNKPKVTIVVPVFNVVNYLSECLDSILSQTLKQIEVIIGDGGSTDGSLEIANEYAKKDKRIKVISREKSGYGESVNECMDMAKGEYIGLVESDDIIKPEMYEALYYIAKTNDLDWIRSDIYLYYSQMPENEQLQLENITYGQDIYNVVLNPQNDCRPYNTALRSWAGIYKKEYLDYYHIRHHETPGGSYQDVGFFLKTLYYAKRIYFLNKPFYMWRQDNPGSSIHYDSRKLVDKSLKEWDLNKQYLNAKNDTDNRMWGSYNYRRFYSYLWTIDLAKGNDKKYATNYAIKELKEAYDKNQVCKDFFSETEWNRFLTFIGENNIEKK